jgi:Replication factor-A protein 1, N-terminal domain
MSASAVPQVKAASVQLLPGTIQALYQDNRGSPLYTSPRLQVIHLKKLNTGAPGTHDAANDRYRVILSDGLAYMQAMLGIQCNPLAASEQLKANAIVVLKKFTCSLVKDRRILIVLDIDTSSLCHCDAKIGTPTNIEEILGVRGGPNETDAGGLVKDDTKNEIESRSNEGKTMDIKSLTLI